MPKSKVVVGVPKWLQEEPSDERKKIIKSNAYSFVESRALSGQIPTSATQSIPEFLTQLSQEDSAFDKIKAKYIKTTYTMIEYIRNQIKNSISKVSKEIKEGRVVPGPTSNQIETPNPIQIEAQDGKDQNEENQQNDDDSSSEAQSSLQSADAEPSASGRSSGKSSVKGLTKQIAKNIKPVKPLKSDKKYPQNWREIAHLKAIIKGKKFEIKHYQMKLAKKTLQYFEESEPVTPPPEEYAETKNTGNY